MDRIKALLRYRPHRSRYFIALFIFLGVAFLFGQLADEVHEGTTLAVDRNILIELRSALATPGLDSFMRVATDIGDKLFVGAVSAVLLGILLYRRRLSRAIELSLSMGGIAVAVILLKLLFARERPDGVGAIVSEPTFSFPSGHSMASAGLAMTIVLLLWHTKWRYPALVLGALYALFVGFSRLYLGVHYPTDVLAGWLLSFGWVVAVFAIIRDGSVAAKK